MKEKMYKYAPVILLSGGLILWLIAFLIDRHYNHNQGLAVWMPFVIIQVVISTICGIFIKKLHQQVHTDSLTGLRNRKYFYTKLSELKSKAPVSLILIDIDDFKSINDTYGHIAGDQVLQQFADILQSNTRKNDIIARWGGEEFMVILPQTDVKEAFKIANRIRTIVENHLFSYENITCKITVSIGITSIKEGADIGTEQFIKTADAALYRAKEKKNFIVTVTGG
ncbi:diguanylate cyclase [Thermanaerosceptrum fracticalcis]|uniref:Diguanylate cyclase n=1 Tax=Thermanaerosceptrum fracticalcis TaxID=1712410 RepID=A0A7G6E353_THEFR|nr:GGDEF domain-containing protein [Thermanaerosceptrum fracticalcis]QNB46507.1 diguanylate cyclase [Thermanaerosceptrum fracticalcis]